MESKQQVLEFALAEAEESHRRCQLGRALRDLNASADLCLLALLIYENTRYGVGDPWRPEGGEETILGHAWGPRIKRSTLYTLKKSEAYRRLLTVADGSYQINWRGVFEARGLPLPESLGTPSTGARNSAAESRAATAATGSLFGDEDRTRAAMPLLETASKSWTGESKSWTPQSRNWTNESSSWTNSSRNWTPSSAETSPQCAPLASARARLFSCFVVMSSSTTTEQNESIRIFAEELARRLFAHLPGSTMLRQAETRRFLACISVLGVLCEEEWGEWIEEAICVAEHRRPRPESPPAFFRGTLRNFLVGQMGVCSTEEDATAVLGQFLAAARPIAKRVLALMPVAVCTPKLEKATSPQAVALSAEEIAACRANSKRAIADFHNY
jgi:hypothetical protein